MRYVYPVISRRSGGLSVGVNLNVDQRCNFDCAYCFIDRAAPPPAQHVDLDLLIGELNRLLDMVDTGELWTIPPFRDVRPDQQVLRDIAISGSAEATTSPRFAEACERIAEVKAQRGLDGVKLVLITNASRLTAPPVQRGLDVLAAHEGEIWAKLDAGDPATYGRVNRSSVPFETVLEGLRDAGRRQPLVIQSMFFRHEDDPPTPAVIDAYVDRLAELLRDGCQIKAVQVYTVARAPMETGIEPLPTETLEAIAQQVRDRLQSVRVEVYGGV